MMKMNKGGLVLTGLGAFLILSRGIHFLDRTVSNLTDAIKWKAYYKSFGKTQNTSMVAPYEAKNELNNTKVSIDNASVEAAKTVVSDAITKMINDLFDSKKREKTAVEVLEDDTIKEFDGYSFSNEINDVKTVCDSDINIYKKDSESVKDTSDTDDDIPKIHVVKDDNNETVD